MKVKLIGGSLYSIIVAVKLRELFPNLLIEIIDGGPRILNMWASKKAGEFGINNGFHGIEMPRSAGLVDFIAMMAKDVKLIKISNEKKIFINGSLCDYTQKSEFWPFGLVKTFPKTDDVNAFGWRVALKQSDFYKIIQKCSIRYGDHADEFLDRFYPWFLPVEYKFSDGDEGYDFQNKVRAGVIKNPFYLQPEEGLFEAMIEPITNALLSLDISVKVNSRFSLRDYDNFNNGSGELNFWMSSMANLYSEMDDLSRLNIKNKRHLHNIIFEIARTPFNFSEVLILDERVPYASRASFLKSIDENRVAIQVEYISELSSICDREIDDLNNLINDIFSCSANFLGGCYGRPIYGLSPTVIEEAEDFIMSHFSNPSFGFSDFVIRPYWYPINMNKCYQYACEDISRYEEIINRA